MEYKIPTFEEAKRVILAIVQEKGGSFAGRTAMFKAFYHAHSFYWRKHGRHLTRHPIVRMVNGPAIDDWLDIFRQLDESEWMRSGREHQFDPERYSLSPHHQYIDLTSEEMEAIQYALERVHGKGVDQLSHESHGLAWEHTKNDGDEMAICLDDLSEQEYAELKASMDQLRMEYDAD